MKHFLYNYFNSIASTSFDSQSLIQRRVFNLKNRMLLLLSLIVLVLGMYLMVLRDHVQKKNSILEGYRNELEENYRSIIRVYTDMSDSIFHLHIDEDEVLSIFEEAMNAQTVEEENLARDKLYRQLEELYRLIRTYNFRQLHFHDRDNHSFLRFHRPEKFGDDLTLFRRTVELANSKRMQVNGFEEGRIFNGYRFVYPLSKNGTHLGTVEVSISMKTIVDQMEDIFSKRSQFILSRSIVEAKVFEDELANYSSWGVDENYLLDLAVADQCMLQERLDESDRKAISKVLDRFGESSGKFSISTRVDGEKTVLSFIPIVNLTGDTVGWFFSRSPWTDIARENRHFLILSLAFAVVLALLIVFTVYYIGTQRAIEDMATFDFLTRSYSREALMDRIQREEELYQRYETPYSLIMLDIDHFKSVNDRFGHFQGDIVLKGMADLMDHNTRKTDIIGRYGGEEFVVLLPLTGLDRAFDVAEKLRLRIEKHSFQDVGNVTVSCGVAERTTGLNGIDEVIRSADEKLYGAKEAGRNRVVS